MPDVVQLLSAYSSLLLYFQIKSTNWRKMGKVKAFVPKWMRGPNPYSPFTLYTTMPLVVLLNINSIGSKRDCFLNGAYFQCFVKNEAYFRTNLGPILGPIFIFLVGAYSKIPEWPPWIWNFPISCLNNSKMCKKWIYESFG